MKYVPCMLIICPNFKAAPRILDNFRTNCSMLAALRIRELEGDSEDDEVARRRDSLRAPKPIPAASAP
jgi:hypothetical protein